MIKTLIFFLLMSFAYNVFAAENRYFQACFNSKSNAIHALKEISFIKNADDRIKVAGRCLDFYVAENRENLYQKYLQVKFLGLYRLGSSTSNTPSKQCNLELVKELKSNNEDINIKLSKRSTLHKRTSQSKKISRMSIIISHGMTGKIQIDKQTLNLKCNVKKTGYQVIISTVSPDFSLSTSRFILLGQTTEIGSFIQDINNKENEINIRPNISFKRKYGKKYASIKLRANE